MGHLNFFQTKLQHFFSLWQSPKEAIHRLLSQRTSSTFTNIIFAFFTVYFLQFIIYAWVCGFLLKYLEIFNRDFISNLMSLFIFIGVVIVFLNLVPIFFYTILKLKNVHSSYIATKTACYWSLITSFPIGFFNILFFWFGVDAKDPQEMNFFILIISTLLQLGAAVATVGFFIYYFYILASMLAEVNKITFKRALVTSIFSLLLSFNVIVATLKIVFISYDYFLE